MSRGSASAGVSAVQSEQRPSFTAAEDRNGWGSVIDGDEFVQRPSFTAAEDRNTAARSASLASLIGAAAVVHGGRGSQLD
ncbi:MAG: hypothetical protein ACRDTD_29485, partial [Pseudonocardiaceae bacterium]